MKGTKFVCGTIGAVLMALLLISAAACSKKSVPAKTAPAKPVTGQPAPAPKVGEPARLFFYKSELYETGKEIWKIQLGVGEEMPLSVQALDMNGYETFACPVDWKYDNTVLQVTPSKSRCQTIKLKGLKASENATLTLVYKGATGNMIENALKRHRGEIRSQPGSRQARGADQEGADNPEKEITGSKNLKGLELTSGPFFAGGNQGRSVRNAR